MLEFVSLFLGLMMGVHTVEVRVGAEVATVELRLDGQPLGTLESEPWSGKFDFGPELAPRELVAVARDAKGEEIASVRQWLNVPRPRAEARLTLERRDGDNPTSARLSWQAVDHDAPRGIAIYFDGERIEVEDPRHFALPEYDPKLTHLLRAEIFFSDFIQARAELVFGGRFGDQVTSDLTAVPVVLKRVSRPRPEELEGWFLRAGKALRVAAVEDPPAKLVVVRELGERNLKGIKSLANARRTRIGQQLAVSWGVRMNSLRFVFPTDARRRTEQGQIWQRMEITKNMVGYGDGRILTALTVLSFPNEVPVATQRLADAVATAGLVAVRGEQPRAVLLVLTGESEDRSNFPVDAVRDYLRSVHVPLAVWTPDRKLAKSGDSAWGKAESINSLQHIVPAIDHLSQKIRSQSIVWLEGSHLPHEIEISDTAKGVRFAGTDG